MKLCGNCHSSAVQPDGTCFQCGQGLKVGPLPNLENETAPEILKNIGVIPGTPKAKQLKRLKAHGVELSKEETANIRKQLGII